MFISRDDARIFATAFGPRSGRDIVGIGGWIGSWELWIDPFSILSESWRTLAYDHRGSGATIAPVETIAMFSKGDWKRAACRCRSPTICRSCMAIACGWWKCCKI